MRKGQFDLSDCASSSRHGQDGRHDGLMAMLPGVAKIKNQLAERNLDDSVLKRQMAIIDSMTPAERKHPDILKASRKKRSRRLGSKVEEVNKLLKMHRTMADMMKAMGGGKARGRWPASPG
jgi:signal recognition particle subunit SRP54